MAWPKSYRFRYKFTISTSNIDSDLTDFPVALHINSAAGSGASDLTKIFDVVGANWQNLCVTSSNEVTPLWTEVDLWDAANENGVLHVRVPKVSSSAQTLLYLYFDADGLGNGYIGATGSAAGQAVWDENFIAVNHLSQDPTGTVLDSTSHATNGVSSGSMTSGDLVDGGCGKAIDFDGSDDLITFTDSDGSLDVTDAVTVEAYINQDVHDIHGASILNKDDAPGIGSYGDYGLIISSTAGRVYFFLNENAKPIYFDGLALDTWTYLAGTYDRIDGNMYLYKNGVQEATDTYSTAISTSSTKYYMGYYWGSTNQANFDGMISEARISNIARSAAWLKATYYTLADGLVSYGSLEYINPVDATIPWLGSWQNRIPLTIPSTNIDEDLTDFPVALFLNSAAGTGTTDVTAVFDALGANSHKIAVTDHTGTRQLFVEIETWDETAESAVLHVKVPHVDADTTTLLYFYYDAAKADNDGFVGDTGDAVAQNVWDDNFTFVFHLNQTPGGAGSVLDSTGNLTGTPTNMESGDIIDGQVGAKAYDFDGSAEWVDCGSDSQFNLGAATYVGTMEVVAKFDDDSSNQPLFGNDRTGSSYGWGNFQFSSSLSPPSIQFNVSRNNVQPYSWVASHTTEVTADGNFHYFSCAIDTPADEHELLIDDDVEYVTGVYLTQMYGSILTTVDIARLHNYTYGTTYFDGPISEVRHSVGKRSVAWMTATYLTLFDLVVAWGIVENYAGIGWLNPYSQRHLITIPTTNIDEGLDYFPVTLSLSSSCGTGTGDMTAVFDEIGANYKKMAVTAADGKTQLPVEVDYWDDTGETAVLHVRVPCVSSTDTTYLYLYYSADVPDNDEFVGDTGEAPAMSVWSNEFVGVWHLNQDPSGTAPQGLDSTVYQHHGTAQGTMLTGDLVDGVIGKATDFDGSDDYYLIPETAALDAVLSPFSVEAIIKVASDWVPANDDYSGILYKGYTNVHPGLRIYERSAGPETRIEFGGTYDVIANSFANGSWKYVAGVAHNRTNDQIFIDGADVGTYDNQTKTTFVANDYDLRIADLYPNTADYVNFPGIISEARISKTDRTDAWIKATYYSLFDGLIAYDTTGEAQTQWLGSWAKRIKLTIDSSKIGATLSNFPVAVKLSASSGILGKDVTAIFSELGANDLKMAVTTSDGVTETYAEVAYWDAVNMRAELHVLIPSISSSVDTVFFLYFDSTQADNTTYIGETGDAAAEYVWDTAGFEAVYHMSQDPSGSLLDSTSNGHDGTFYGSMDSNDLVESPKGMALEFDGSDDYITTPNSTNLAPNQYDYTYEAFYRTSKDYADDQGRIYNDYGNDVDNYLELSVQTTNKISHYMRDLGGDALAIQTAGAEINDGVWHHNVMARDTLTHMDAYEDGAWIGEDTNGAVGNVRTYDGSAVPTFGKHASSSTLYFKGQIAEVRLTFNEARDADWVAATYYTLMDELIYVSTPVIYNNWPKGWTNRRAFVIPGTNIDDTLTDFPITLHLSSSSGTGTEDITDIFDEVGENYKRLAVADARGRLLPTEVELWDATAENGILHVKVPRIDSDYGAILFLYFNDNQPDQGWVGDTGEYIAQRVWDDDFMGVWHFGQDPTGGSGCIKDSTSNGKNGTPSGSMTSGDLIDGTCGKSLDFDGSNDLINVSAIGSDLTVWTVEGISSRSDTSYDMDVFTNDLSGYNDDVLIGYDPENGGEDLLNDRVSVMHQDSTDSIRTWAVPGEGQTIGVEGYWAAYGDGSYIGVRANAGTVVTTAKNGTATTLGNNALVFGSNNNVARPLYGTINEIRVSDIVRSDAWTKATYYTLFDDLGEWGVAEAEPAGGEIEIELTNLSLEITVHSLSTELSMTLYLGTPSVEITPHALSTSYIGNIVKMIGVDASRPRIADASSKRAGIAKATGSHPGLAAAEAFEYQERE